MPPPPWNFPNQGILLDLSHLRVEIPTFHDFYSILPPLDSNPYTGAELYLHSVRLTNSRDSVEEGRDSMKAVL